MTILQRIFVCGAVASMIHCSGESGQTGVTAADAGSADAAAEDARDAAIPASCTRQAAQLSSAYCSETEALLVCPPELGPAPAGCKRAVPADAYCCADRVAPVASLLVCAGLTANAPLSATMRFYVLPGGGGDTYKLSLLPLRSTARTLAKSETVAPTTDFQDNRPTVDGFVATANQLVVPSEVLARGFVLEAVTLSGGLPLAHARLEGKGPLVSYAGACVFLAGEEGDAFTMTDTAVTLRGKSVTTADLK